MRRALLFVVPLVVLGALALVVSAAVGKELKLKPGARGKICTTCHVAFEEKLKSRFVHTPVKTGECSSCHNPHASSHGKLLAADTDKICAQCHGDMVPAEAASSHKVVVEGNCVGCHDPHGSDNRGNLVRAGNELCFGCHAGMKEAIANVKYSHSPVEAGCLSCHNPHASKEARKLLASEVPTLCFNCHQTEKKVFKVAHMNYPVTEGRCTLCHNPHGSSKAAILYDNVHMPVENRMCDQCHMEPSSPTPLALKQPGYELCRSCHYDMVNEALNKDRLHWPMLGERGCVNCHSPHAASQNKLLWKPTGELCGSCHADTIARLAESPVKHVPVAEGNCTACHSPHSSDGEFILSRPSVIDVCAGCHDWQSHTSHPIGEDFTDPRNRNLSVMCLSCHRSHGTENEHMLHFGAVSDMCVQCHVTYRR